MLVFIVVCLSPCMGNAQEMHADTLHLKGTEIIRIFANLHHGLTREDPSKAFELRRVYLGYSVQLNRQFSTEVKMDIGSPDDISEYSRLRRYAYFKTAALYWEKDCWNIKAGIIDTEHYKSQEQYWKHRYIYKSFQDKHRFGPKADLGATFLFSPLDILSLDVSIMNGEGYHNLQRDNTFKYSAGISVHPLSTFILRLYYDLENKEIDQSTLAGFMGWQLHRLFGGAEYNRKFNNDFRSGHHQTGLSFYLSYDLNEKFELFGRYDHLSSNIPPEYHKPWNLLDDGSAIITGIQLQPVRQVRLALNYQDWVPSAANMNASAFLYLNLEVNY